MPRVIHLIIAFAILCYSATSSAGTTYMDDRSGSLHVSIGITLNAFPELRVVPGYPVYYAPRLNANYFFYDGMYWVYRDDTWYSSAWYDGPWWATSNEDVPLYILRIPVRYYRQPPKYFHGWKADAPPRWGDHWGRDWENHRSGWDKWNRRSAPAPAHLPTYQKKYSGDRYPRQVDRQRVLQQHDYRYQPRDSVVRKLFQRLYIEPATEQAPARKGTSGQRGQGGEALHWGSPPASSEQKLRKGQEPGQRSQSPVPAGRETPRGQTAWFPSSL